jgi:hypothetical protein
MNIARGKRKSICPQVTLIDADKEILDQEGTEGTEMETLRSAFHGGNPPRKARRPDTGPGHWLHDGKRQNAHRHGLTPCPPCPISAFCFPNFCFLKRAKRTEMGSFCRNAVPGSDALFRLKAGKGKSICPQMTLIDADKEILEQEGTEGTEMETLRAAFSGGNPPRKARPPETGPGHWLHDGKRQNAHKHGLAACTFTA